MQGDGRGEGESSVGEASGRRVPVSCPSADGEVGRRRRSC